MLGWAQLHQWKEWLKHVEHLRRAATSVAPRVHVEPGSLAQTSHTSPVVVWSDPCRNTTALIASSDLFPASFNPDLSILPNDYLNASSNNWYTCGATDPPFPGCRRSNPYTEGTDLIPAAWSTSKPGQLQVFLEEPRELWVTHRRHCRDFS